MLWYKKSATSNKIKINDSNKLPDSVEVIGPYAFSGFYVFDNEFILGLS